MATLPNAVDAVRGLEETLSRATMWIGLPGTVGGVVTAIAGLDWFWVLYWCGLGIPALAFVLYSVGDVRREVRVTGGIPAHLNQRVSAHWWCVLSVAGFGLLLSAAFTLLCVGVLVGLIDKTPHTSIGHSTGGHVFVLGLRLIQAAGAWGLLTLIAALLIRPWTTTQPAAAIEPRSQPDRIDQLSRLAELREKDRLTEEEYRAEKARVLGADAVPQGNR